MMTAERTYTTTYEDERRKIMEHYAKQQCNMIGNPHLSQGLLKNYAKEENSYVRRCVAKHANTPQSVLAELAKDNDWFVRSGVAQNTKTPVELLLELAKDSNYLIRESVAENSSTPLETLIELANDEKLEVMVEARANLYSRRTY